MPPALCQLRGGGTSIGTPDSLPSAWRLRETRKLWRLPPGSAEIRCSRFARIRAAPIMSLSMPRVYSWLANFCDKVTLHDIARAIFSSPFHLAHVFRRETGGTLHSHLSRLRLCY